VQNAVSETSNYSACLPSQLLNAGQFHGYKVLTAVASGLNNYEKLKCLWVHLASVSEVFYQVIITFRSLFSDNRFSAGKQ